MVQREIDPIWNEYMGAPRGAEDLALLLGNKQVRPPFKDRVLQTLLAPDVRKLPFLVTTDRRRRNFLGERVGLRGILQDQPELATQAATLVEQHIEELSRRSSLFDPKIEKVSDNYACQFLILTLLPVIPQDQAAKLFSHFRVDTQASWDTDSKVYSPDLQRALYQDPDIDEAYKRQAALQIHEIIEKRPRVRFAGSEGNISARMYGQDLDLLVLQKLRGLQLPVSRQFFQDEIAFLLGVDTNFPILSSWVTTAEAAQLLDDSQVKHGFLRRQFLPLDPDSSHSRIFDRLTDAQAASRDLLTYFPQDSELTTSIQAQLVKLKEREKLEAGQSKRALDAAIISRMSR